MDPNTVYSLETCCTSQVMELMKFGRVSMIQLSFTDESSTTGPSVQNLATEKAGRNSTGCVAYF